MTLLPGDDLATASSSTASEIQTDATYAYYYDSGTNKFMRAPKVGGGAPTPISPSGAAHATAALFVVDDKRLYFFGPKGDLNTDNQQKLYAFNKDGTGGVVEMAALGADNVSKVAQDAKAIYWTTYGRDPDNVAPYQGLFKIAK